MLSKDLLIFDLDTASPETEKCAVVQIAGVLLEKHNLLETQNFHSYSRLSFLEGSIKEHSKLLEVEPEVLRQAPRLPDTLKNFFAKFPTNFQLACFGPQALWILTLAGKRTGVKIPIEPPIFDIWTAAYLKILKSDQSKLPNFSTAAAHFNLKIRNQKNALERVRIMAEMIRKIISNV